MGPSRELQQVLFDLYAAMSSGDADAVEAFYSLEAGCIFVGSDHGEFWLDSMQHNVEVRPFFDGTFGEVTWRPGEAYALVEGSVGWTVDRPTLVFGGREYPMRVSLVWHREGDRWLVVHSHTSAGASNSE
jgi:hypothetical protein